MRIALATIWPLTISKWWLEHNWDAQLTIINLNFNRISFWSFSRTASESQIRRHLRELASEWLQIGILREKATVQRMGNSWLAICNVDGHVEWFTFLFGFLLLKSNYSLSRFDRIQLTTKGWSADKRMIVFLHLERKKIKLLLRRTPKKLRGQNPNCFLLLKEQFRFGSNFKNWQNLLLVADSRWLEVARPKALGTRVNFKNNSIWIRATTECLGSRMRPGAGCSRIKFRRKIDGRETHIHTRRERKHKNWLW